MYIVHGSTGIMAYQRKVDTSISNIQIQTQKFKNSFDDVGIREVNVLVYTQIIVFFLISI